MLQKNVAPKTTLEGLCFTLRHTPGYNTPTLRPCNFRNGQPNLILIGHSALAIIFPYIVL